jgi:hypothetical protein
MISAPSDMWGINAFTTLVGQIGEERACKILDIHRTTLNRYLAEKTRVPKPCVLALYWESNWGRAVIDSDHRTEIQLLYQKIHFLRMENKRLVKAIDEMEIIADFGTANAPILEARPVR